MKDGTFLCSPISDKASFFFFVEMSQTFARLSISKVASMMDMCRKLRWKNTDSGKPDSGVLIQAGTEIASVLQRFSPDIKLKEVQS